MTVGEWIASRTPQPPMALRERVAYRLGEGAQLDAGEARETCMDAARQTITELTSAGGTSRDSAIDLLAADALITYAIEAAADSAGLREQLDDMIRELSAIAEGT